LLLKIKVRNLLSIPNWHNHLLQKISINHHIKYHPETDMLQKVQ